MEEEQHPKQKKVFAEVFNEILKSKERAKPIVDEDARKDTVAKRELRLKKSEALQLAHKPYSEWDSSIEKKNRVVATKAVVQLFNAFDKEHKFPDEILKARRRRRRNDTGKNAFLNLLHGKSTDKKK